MIPIVTGKTTPVLHMHTEHVDDPTAPEWRALVPEMIETMRKAEGVGLAAPQIGKSVSLAVIEVDNRVSVYFNPKIVKSSKEVSVLEEGCLSIPGEFFPIERAASITVEYDDESGRHHTIDATGFLATVLQHEIDHLEGVLIADRYQKQDNENIYEV